LLKAQSIHVALPNAQGSAWLPASIGETSMSRVRLAILIIAAFATFPAHAAGKKITQLWNLTGETLDRVELAPAGTTAWGRNQCANDKDGEVDFDEKLPITGIQPGRYDIRVRDVHGKVCIAKAVEVKEGETFVIHEKELVGCTP
jgi:hypothetical protein